MKRKNILNRLKLELENSLPDSGEMINKVKTTKVEKDLTPVYDAIYRSGGTMALKSRYNTAHIAAIMFATMLMFTLLLLLLPVFNAILHPEKNIVTKFGIDINPSIDLMLDENDEVVLCLAKNKHAEILLKGENFEGKSVAEATNQIIKLAARAGYFSTEAEQTEIANAVMISAVSENEKKQQSLLESVKGNIKNFYLNNQIYGVVLTEFSSKQELVDLVCSLDYDLTETQKEQLKNESIKNLNHMLSVNYTKLKRRFKADFILEELNNSLNPITKKFNEEARNIEVKIEETENKINNFEKEWNAETEICKQKIEEWEKQIEDLQEAINLATTPEEESLLTSQLETKQKFLHSEEKELKKREENSEMFNSSKNSLVALLNNYKQQMDTKHNQWLSNLERAINQVKQNINLLGEKITSRKQELLSLGDAKFNKHLNNLQNYNTFYNSYSNWLLNTADKLPGMQQNWKQVKGNWEQNYSSFVQF